ncbi:MAG TPA: hypothetical protein VLA29_11680 [Acidimicrobiia bacterium]|nr:hypothetical protein [Acidimicrobiia bacterium]
MPESDETFDDLDELNAAIERRVTRLMDLAGPDVPRDRTVLEGTAAESMVAVDADGHLWRAVPGRPGMYRYSRDRGTTWTFSDAARFPSRPALSLRYADIGTSRILALVVRFLEPIAYIAAAAIGIGLWALLGDLLGSLPAPATVAALGISAVALGAGAYVLPGDRFREVHRLTVVMYVAAVAVAAWTVYVATGWLVSDDLATRSALSFATVFAVAFPTYLRQRDLPSYAMTAVGAVGTAWSVGAMTGRLVASILGILTGVAVVYLVAGSTASGSRRLWAYVCASILTWSAISVALGLEEGERFVVVAAAFVVAGVSYLPVRSDTGDLRIFVIGNFVAAGLLGLTLASWLPFRRLFEAVPVPVLLVVGGTAALVALVAVVRTAIRRIDAGTDGSGGAD